MVKTKTNKIMKTLLFIFFLAISIIIIGEYCESKKNPYEVGIHLGYKIKCENGFVYKQLNRGTIQVLNSDGTPLRCGKKIY
jgi:hypothetical protein